MIEALAGHLGRDIVVLDLGGRPDYWGNVGVGSIERIELVNTDEAELDRQSPPGFPESLLISRIGDARELSDYADQSVDLVHSNSVIEHVGQWDDMAAMAREALRVGRAGWMQTPAWSFPVEPHFRAPFMHWFGRPLQARMMALSAYPEYRQADIHVRRRQVERINLLSKQEVRALFPAGRIYVERAIVAKSYTAYWLPDGIAPPT